MIKNIQQKNNCIIIETHRNQAYLFKPQKRTINIEYEWMNLQFNSILFTLSKWDNSLISYMANDNPFKRSTLWMPTPLPHVNELGGVCLQNNNNISLEMQIDLFWNTNFDADEMIPPFIDIGEEDNNYEDFYRDLYEDWEDFDLEYQFKWYKHKDVPPELYAILADIHNHFDPRISNDK